MTARAIINGVRRAALGIAGGAAIAFWSVELGWPVGGPESQRIAIWVMAAASAVWIGCRLAGLVHR